jgi:multidrug resistance efflux pump
MKLQGKIVALKAANIKFSISGKLSSINCKIQDKVNKGQLLATLNKTELQAYLDRSLKQYDLERALFDEKQKQELTEYEKRKYQDSLDISVKDVEIAKANLEATNLNSSINGIVINIDPANPGDNITPAGFIINIIDPESFCFQAELPEEDISQVSLEQAVKVELKAYPDKILEGKVEQIGFSSIKEGLFLITISIPVDPILRLGLSGTATF